MQTYRVEVFENGRWEHWVELQAYNKNHAEAMVLDTRPNFERFRVVLVIKGSKPIRITH